MRLKKDRAVSKSIVCLCVCNLDLNLLNEILLVLKELDLNSQLYTQVESDDDLSVSLHVKMKVNEMNESAETCMHFMERAGDRQAVRY